MIVANLPLLINGLFLAVYFIFAPDKRVLPDRLVLWPWALFFCYLALQHYAFSVQCATQRVARQYLLRAGRLDSSEAESMLTPHGSRVIIAQIQAEITPPFMAIHTLLWVPLDIGSFIAFTVTQGWLTAVISKVVAFILPWALPMLYSHHLRNIRDAVEKRTVRKPLSLVTHGVLVSDLLNVIEHEMKLTRAHDTGNDAAS